MAFTATGGHGPQQTFPPERIAVMTICPAMREHFVDPQFQQRGCAVPLHRVLPDNQIGPGDRFLFGSDIYIEIGVELVERTDLYALQRLDLIKHPFVRMGMMRIRMGVNNEYHD